MKPDIWGPHAWYLLHSITLDYPENPTELHKRNMTNFIKAFQLVIPCEKCKINFNKHLSAYPLNDNILKSKLNLVKWMIDMHNSVNRETGKKILSYDDALDDLISKYNNENKKSISSVFSLICVFVIVIIAIIFYYSNRFT
jgi:FAD-linked sulfhydryl oxidase